MVVDSAPLGISLVTDGRKRSAASDHMIEGSGTILGEACISAIIFVGLGDAYIGRTNCSVWWGLVGM